MDEISTRVIAALIALTVIIIGFTRKARKLPIYKKRLEFTRKYRKHFYDYANSLSGNQDRDSYDYLIRNSYEMQGMMGGYGVMSSFRPAYGNYIIPRYEIILNAIPEIDSHAENFPLSSHNSIRWSYVKMVDEALVRFEGVLENKISEELSQLKNPLLWLKEGVEFLIMPLLLLPMWFGVISKETVRSLSESSIFKLMNFLVSMLGAASAIITIALGWDGFLALLQKYGLPLTQ